MLLHLCQDLIKAELDSSDAGRPVYLLGESFGGLLSLALAIKLGDYIDRLVLVNPASSFADSPWPALGPLLAQLPPDVYKFLPFVLVRWLQPCLERRGVLLAADDVLCLWPVLLVRLQHLMTTDC